MNKEELVQEISKKAKVTQKEAAEVLGSLVETIQKTVSKGEKVTLVGFGTFEARKRAARTGRNPQTGKEIKIAAKTVPAFSAGKNFKVLGQQTEQYQTAERNDQCAAGARQQGSYHSHNGNRQVEEGQFAVAGVESYQ